MTRGALVLLLSIFCCFLADASLTKQKLTKQKFRGSMLKKAHNVVQQSSTGDSDDDDDDDDDDEDDAAPASATQKDEVDSSTQQQLAANLRKQLELKQSLASISDEQTSDRQVEKSAKLVSNETASPALGALLGGMWKDMRMFETPFYSEHVKEEIQNLKSEERALVAKLKESQPEDEEADGEKDTKKEKKKEPEYGSPDCQCIGIDELDGGTTVKLAGEKVSYPADLGARCEAWDAKNHPDCPGKSWCKQKWCYVDPCKCKNLLALPKPATYLPDARYQGKPVHFSYATCGGSDSFSKKEMKKTAKELEETCAVKVDTDKWGAEGCRCVGVGPQPGTTKVVIKGKQRKFPADTGAFCQAWEEDRHPDCKGDSPPDWCSQEWCYVDPCSCNMPTPPKTSSYVPDGNYQGRPVYFSYATCGGKDSWTAGNKEACVNQKTNEDCAKLKKCGWTGKECLGKELVSVCKPEDSVQESAAWKQNAIMALTLPLLALVY